MPSSSKYCLGHIPNMIFICVSLVGESFSSCRARSTSPCCLWVANSCSVWRNMVWIEVFYSVKRLSLGVGQHFRVVYNVCKRIVYGLCKRFQYWEILTWEQSYFLLQCEIKKDILQSKRLLHVTICFPFQQVGILQSKRLLYVLKVALCDNLLSISASGTRKRNRQQKMRHLNRQGDAKEGSDMDAFTDKASPAQVRGKTAGKIYLLINEQIEHLY